MSLLDDLAVRLTDASDGLPVPELRRAVGAISRAADRLRYVAATESLARLGLATAHLESSVSLLLRAQDEVAAYLATIGATVPAVSPGFVPVSAVAAGDCDGGPLPPEDERWWARRIGELTGERAAAERVVGGRVPGGRAAGVPAVGGDGSVGALLRTVAGCVGSGSASGSRAGLAEALVAAGPGVGLALSGEASPRLPGLVEAWLGRPVRPSDVGAVGGRAGFGAVLPGLSAGVAAALVARACRMDRSAPEDDPAGFAVGAAVLAGRIAAAAGVSLNDASGRRGHGEHTDASTRRGEHTGATETRRERVTSRA